MTATKLAALSLIALATTALATPPSPPNVVLIFSDDQGIADVGCYGSEIPTPNIDRIAATGVRFTNFYSASSICTPSRFGLLTGMNPSRSHDQLLGALMFMGAGDRDRGIRPHETTIASVLRNAGFDTALIGKWHLGHGGAHFLPTAHGFSEFVGHTGGCIDYFTMTYGVLPDWYHGDTHVAADGYATELITDHAVRFLSARTAESKPFFLYLAYNAPHFGKGYSPAEGKPVNIMQPQAADLKRVPGIPDKIRREFAAMTVNMDDGIGRVLDTLEARGLDRNTLVVFLTDHGGDPVYGGSNRPLRGDKATLFEGGLRVPCVARFPGTIPAGTVSDDLTSSLDLFPTICELAGVDTAGLRLDGVSIAAPLSGKPSPANARRELFWELGAHRELGRRNWTALRQGRWKYVAPPAQPPMLFDLGVDPTEANDLAATQPDRLRTLAARARELAARYRPQN